jgi:hypothetical protein
MSALEEEVAWLRKRCAELHEKLNEQSLEIFDLKLDMGRLHAAGVALESAPNSFSLALLKSTIKPKTPAP